MKKLFLTFLILLSSSVTMADGPIFLQNLNTNATGSVNGSHDGLDVNVISPITATNPSVGIVPSPVPSSATFVGGSNPSGDLEGINLDSSGNVLVDVNSSVLPTGAATSALQVTGNGILTTISNQLPAALGQTTMANSLACVLPSNQSAIPVSQNGVWTVQPGNTANTIAWLVTGTGGTFPITAASLPLPTNASTSTLQTSGNSTLTTISGQLPSALGPNPTASSLSVVPATGAVFAASAPINANSTLSARQTVTGTESDISAPSNSVGVIVECESVNTDNLRWGFSNSATAILSTTLGMLCEPGRDSGYLPLGAGNYLHMISTGSGSDYIDVSWVKSQ